MLDVISPGPVVRGYPPGRPAARPASRAPATAATMATPRVLIRHYYGLPVRLPYYAGGYFWWYCAEDCLPYGARPLWRAVNAGFTAEAEALGG